MERRYQIVVSPECDRDLRRVRKRNPELCQALLDVRHVLQHDPFNRMHRADIVKLEDVPAGHGQYRLRVGSYRLRHDIVGDEVVLYSFRPRTASYR